MIYNLINRSKINILPKASDVLNSYLRQENFPAWTSYFVKYKDVINDQYRLTYFINKVDNHEYLILRTGCFPLIKYHCTKLKTNEFIDYQQIKLQNKFFNLIKLANLGNYTSKLISQ